jgi:hypothetical protein
MTAGSKEGQEHQRTGPVLPAGLSHTDRDRGQSDSKRPSLNGGRALKVRAAQVSGTEAGRLLRWLVTKRRILSWLCAGKEAASR